MKTSGFWANINHEATEWQNFIVALNNLAQGTMTQDDISLINSRLLTKKMLKIVHFGYTQGLLMLTEKMKYFFYYYPSEEFINKATDYIIGNVS